MAAPTPPDFTQLARRPSERLAIVTFVHGTANLQETEYLEWKSAYDLSKRPGAAATARQMIGMANRDDASAGRHAEGHAYLLIGVEPGNVPGVPESDTAEVESWLRRFVEDELRYDLAYVAYERVQVLFVTIDAPRIGDPIYSLQKSCTDPVTGKGLEAGTIYVRHGSSTAPATPDDVKRLAARATATTPTKLDLAVELDPSRVEVIDPRLLADEHRDRTLSRWHAQMHRALPRKETGPFAALSYMPTPGETRSEQEYISEVDQYIHAVKNTDGVWWGVMAEKWLEANRSILGVSVVNGSEENYENTVVELTFELPRVCVHLRSHELGEVAHLPEQPRKWGTSLIHSIAPRVIAAHKEPKPEIERLDERRTLVRFPELRVRPRTPHKLEPILLALGPALAGTVIPVHWRVTSSSTKSDLSGDIELSVPGGPEQVKNVEAEGTEARESAA